MTSRTVMLFMPNDYSLNVLLSLQARALRVLLMLAARYNSATGMCHCSKKEMKTMLSGKRCNLSHAIGDLIKADLVARGKRLDTYWLNPAVFAPFQILLPLD